MDFKTLALSPRAAKRLATGHLWVFSNEVDASALPLKAVTPGERVRVTGPDGRFIGMAYGSPGSTICARIYSRSDGEDLNADLLRRRIGRALELRSSLFDAPCYRLLFGEGDLLPGLIADRYDDVLVLQSTTFGMERVLDDVVSVLADTLTPRGVLLKNESGVRRMEEMELYTRTALGDVPEEVELTESGVRFTAPLAEGQKTGWFYDQRLNRAEFARYAMGGSVLDVFSYVGSLGVMAAARGAGSATCVDQSDKALAFVRRNAELSGVSDRVDTLAGNAFDLLNDLRDAGRTYDAVCVDPPAFMKKKKDRARGLKAYNIVNWLALSLVRDGGVLLSCSCSYHLSRQDLRVVLAKAAAKAGVSLQILWQGHQGQDHPVHPAMPETDYLKGYLVRVLR